jgi:hypothetical protein
MAIYQRQYQPGDRPTARPTETTVAIQGLLQVDIRSITEYDDTLNLMRYNNDITYIENLQQHDIDLKHVLKFKVY